MVPVSVVETPVRPPNLNCYGVTSMLNLYILSLRTCCRGQGDFYCPVTSLYPSRVPLGSPPALWHSSIDNCGNLPMSSGFAVGPASPSPDLQRAPFLILQRATPLGFQGVPPLRYSFLYWGIHPKSDLSDCAKLPTLRTAITTYVLILSRKRRNRMLTLLNPIGFPHSMVYTVHYLRDC